jgi:integral membrane protein
MKNTFRVVSILEGLSYIVLLFIAVPIKYLGGDESYVKLLGMPHGLLFVGYIALAFLIKKSLKWDSKTFLLVLTASVIPFGTFYIDKKYLRG